MVSAGDDVGEAGASAGVAHQGGGRERAADRHALEDAGGDVGGALTDEVAGGLGYSPSGLV